MVRCAWFVGLLAVSASVAGVVGCGGSTPVDAGTDVTAEAAVPDAGDVPGVDAADAPVSDATDATAADGDGGSPGCALRNVVVTTTDFSVGGYVVGDLATRTLRTVAAPAAMDGGAPVGPPQDHVVRTSGCQGWDLWRTFASATNAVVTLDPADPYHPARQIPLDPVPGGPDGGTQAANPYDIAVLSPSRAYVTQYNSPRVLVVDPSRSGAAARTGAIDLAPLADADGIPEADSIAVVGARAFITLQQINRATYAPPAHSHVAVVDTATDQLVDADPAMPGVQGIELGFGNPNGRMALTPDRTQLLVVSSGDAVAPGTDGGLDVIDLATLRVVRSVPGAMLGGDPGSVEALDGGVAWVTIARAAADAGSVYRIVEVTLATGAVRAAPVAESTQVAYGGLRLAPDGTIWAIDTGFGLAGSVHAFRRDGTAALATPFATPGFNTYSLDFVP